MDGLSVTSATETSISGSVTISVDNVAGRGPVKYLEIQTKVWHLSLNTTFSDTCFGDWSEFSPRVLLQASDQGDWKSGGQQLLRPLDKCMQRADAKSAETSVTMVGYFLDVTYTSNNF